MQLSRRSLPKIRQLPKKKQPKQKRLQSARRRRRKRKTFIPVLATSPRFSRKNRTKPVISNRELSPFHREMSTSRSSSLKSRRRFLVEAPPNCRSQSRSLFLVESPSNSRQPFRTKASKCRSQSRSLFQMEAPSNVRHLFRGGVSLKSRSQSLKNERTPNRLTRRLRPKIRQLRK